MSGLMHMAAITGNLQMLALLREYRVPTFQINKIGDTPLHVAIK